MPSATVRLSSRVRAPITARERPEHTFSIHRFCALTSFLQEIEAGVSSKLFACAGMGDFAFLPNRREKSGNLA